MTENTKLNKDQPKETPQSPKVPLLKKGTFKELGITLLSLCKDGMFAIVNFILCITVIVMLLEVGLTINMVIIGAVLLGFGSMLGIYLLERPAKPEQKKEASKRPVMAEATATA